MARVRVQLDLAAEQVAALDQLRDRCSLRSRAEAVRYALGVIEWVANEHDRGGQVLSIDRETVTPLLLPGITTGPRVQPGLPSRGKKR